MKFGTLSDYFSGVGAKKLTEVEVNKLSSNQHEFQGVHSFKNFLDECSEPVRMNAIFFWLSDEQDQPLERVESFCTWSDVRRAHPTRSEYHLYYSSESERIVHKAKAGDILIIAQQTDGSLLVFICANGTTISQQLLWLFGLQIKSDKLDFRRLSANSTELNIAASWILEEIGVELSTPQSSLFEQYCTRFGEQFIRTSELSEFVRNFTNLDLELSPDEVLLEWLTQEEALFRQIESLILSSRLQQGFIVDGTADVDGFIKFSLSVQNRRKSRAGYALANHVEAILKTKGIKYVREATTEKRAAADFLFPSEASYHDRSFPDADLKMLAVKTSCKDRWRQVLAEANRIWPKHLLTLEPAISVAQTQEMESSKIQLVLPSKLHETYLPEQRDGLMSVSQFLSLVE